MSGPARDRYARFLRRAATCFLAFAASATVFPGPGRAMEAVDFPQALARAFRGNPFLAAAGFDYAASRE